MSLKHAAQQLIRRHRRSAPLATAAKVAEKYLKFWYNEDFYEFEHNGEGFAMSRFAQWAASRPVTVWDVGAHRGGWSDAALERLPAAHIHSFEIVPEVAAGIAPNPRRTVHALGLSDREGEVSVNRNHTYDTSNSIEDWSGDRLYVSGRVETITCDITTGDALASRLPKPDLLKIDVEGHEVSTLRGCARLLSGPKAPVMIQVEYGNTYLYSGTTLRDVYRLLPGYAIGRLYPDHVDFRPYDSSDDRFRMGNMIAVKDDRLRAALA